MIKWLIQLSIQIKISLEIPTYCTWNSADVVYVFFPFITSCIITICSQGSRAIKIIIFMDSTRTLNKTGIFLSCKCVPMRNTVEFAASTLIHTKMTYPPVILYPSVKNARNILALKTSFDLVSSVQFSHSVVSDSLWTQWLQHARLPCPSPTPGACSNSCPSSQWCHPTISSSVAHFCSCVQSFPASGSFQMSQFFASGGQSIGFQLQHQSFQRIFRTDFL